MAEIKISMLGDFSITYKDKVLNEQTKRSKNLWLLMRYLIVFHNREISLDELIELLWSDESSENPMNALKTLLHRTRTVLRELDYPTELIISSNGTYAWNNNADFSVDSEEFEQLCKKSFDSSMTDDERLTYLRDALALYKGDFLTKMSSETWVIPLTEYYRSLYRKAVTDTVGILDRMNSYSEAIDVCETALIIDPCNEALQHCYLKALIDSKQIDKAKTQYNFAVDLLRAKLGVTPSEELVNLMGTIVNTNSEKNPNIDDVSSMLAEEPERKGAFFCDYEFFRYLYQLEMRQSSRENKNTYLVLLTVQVSQEENTADFIETSAKAMRFLSTTIGTSLRKGDTYAKLNSLQYLLLLHNANEETNIKILQRLMKNFKRAAAKTNATIDCKSRALPRPEK